jgi:hypothetical protein
MQKFLLGVAIAMGGLISYLQARPNLSDTGITAVILLLVSAFFGFLQPKRPWLFALALGIWVPILGFFRTQSIFAVLALVLAFVGAYSGAALRKWLPAVKK